MPPFSRPHSPWNPPDKARCIADACTVDGEWADGGQPARALLPPDHDAPRQTTMEEAFNQMVETAIKR